MLNDPTFWVAIAFFVFAGLMIWKARQPVLKGLDARAERIKTELDEAQRLREEAQKMLAEYKRKQRDVAKEADDLLANARHEADLLRRQAAADLEQTLARREKAALEKIAQAETQAVLDVRAKAVDIAIAATAKLLSENVDATRDQALLDDAIKNLGSRLH
ncbi:MAG: F0F1 ATP synthase subunit B [Kiloniellaceae bacterium]|nr:F0F1 ATP synthase subunit B [Kiloniellaceae bacterium]